ncbi:MAG: RagB/SusD family nutrient uptake outer membrane protein [Dysgonomonas sp.]|nr:RagB/SusD family nutrient uptake outer membrane protein [Dysgonomonas sp.]
MKRIIYFISIIAVLSLISCDDFLDTKNYSEKDLTNFPETVEDANQMLTGIYASMNVDILSGFYIAELASDDRFGGGGEGDKFMHAIDRLMTDYPDRFSGLWWARYRGIERANLLFENIDRVSGWKNEQQKNQVVGEAYYLRAMFYFELMQVYGEVPLMLTTEALNLPKSSAEEVYAQITSDLKNAIEMMDDAKYDPDLAGHATKWSAEALMARVFLFYTGYYKKESLPLVEGGNVTKTEVTNWLSDCINNSGHELIIDNVNPGNGFYNLWPYSNEYTAVDYQWAQDKKVKWVGDGNKETVFAIRYNNFGNWDQTGYTNMHATHFGIRTPNGNTSTFPFGEGYGAGTVNPQLVEYWKSVEPNDIRLWGSIIDVENDLPGFEWGADLQMEETGYFQKKYLAITAYDYTDGGREFVTSYSHLMYGTPRAPVELASTQDLVLIRFADVLLMHSELTQTSDGINKVRERAGLTGVGAYTFDALKKERRLELAFEGVRWYDLMRWGEASTALDKQGDVMVRNMGGDPVQMAVYGGGWSARYAATGGFWPIPQTQITRSAGVLVQNKGWGTADAEYRGW